MQTLHFSTFRWIFIAAGMSLVLNLFFWHSAPLGVMAGMIFFIVYAMSLGQLLIKHPDPWWRFILGLLLGLCLLSIFGATAFYALQLNSSVIALIIVCITIIGASVVWTKTNSQSIEPREQTQPTSWLMMIAFLGVEVVNFFILYKSQTGEAIRSPWQVVPKEFFIWYFFATFFLTGFLIFYKKYRYALPMLVTHYALSVSVAVIVYVLGYGFDPFIHRATENIIAATGTISPKPLYYVGQYALVIIVSKIFSLPIEQIDIFLVPTLFAVFLPLIIHFSFSQIMSKKNTVSVVALAFLIFPLASFIVTTPQSLANCLTLFAILLSTNVVFGKNRSWLLPIAIFIAAAVATHPLTGIPGIIFFIILFIYSSTRDKSLILRILQKILIAEWALLACFFIPLVFIFNGEVSRGLSSVLSFEFLHNPKILLDALAFLKPNVFNNFHLFLDLAYWYQANVFILLIIGSVLGAYLLIRRHHIHSTWVYVVTFGILLTNYVLLRSLVRFPDLIDYERINYPNRLLEIAFYFLAPLVLYAAAYIFTWAKRRYPIMLIFASIMLAFFCTSSLYISYPRADDYHLDRGYNITQSDINAVHYIEENAQGDYIVLANQMTSVAAIKEFGFKKYYPQKNHLDKQLFYYPIPTGDALYQYYIDMVYVRPTKKTALAAADLVGVPTTYFILNRYWDSFDRLIEEAKQEADFFISIDQGKVFVFMYHTSNIDKNKKK